MPGTEFKLVPPTADWGSPLSLQPTFDSLEEAQSAAREYIADQRREGGPGGVVNVMIQEKRSDGTVIEHRVG